MNKPLNKQLAQAQARRAELFPVRQDFGSGELLDVGKMTLLVNWAKQFGLNAWLGHVCLYHGKPFVQLAGRLFHAHKHTSYEGYITQPGMPDEREAHQLEEGDFLWSATVYDKEMRMPVTEYGIVRRSEIEAMSKKDPTQQRSPVVANNPSLMAEKRALARALERAYPLGLDIVEEAEQVMSSKTDVQDAQESLDEEGGRLIAGLGKD